MPAIAQRFVHTSASDRTDDLAPVVETDDTARSQGDPTFGDPCSRLEKNCSARALGERRDAGPFPNAPHAFANAMSAQFATIAEMGIAFFR